MLSTLCNFMIREFDITIVTLVKSDPFYPLDKNIKIDYCIPDKPRYSGFLGSISLNWKLASQLVKILRKERPHLCVSFLTRANILTAIAGRICSTPVVISERNNPYMQDSSLSPFWKFLRRRTYPLAHTLVVQTKRIGGYYSDWFKGNIEIIQNPLNPEFRCADEANREDVILNIGRLDKQKNQELLINAFASLEPGSWKLVILGEGSERKRLQELINSLGCDDRVMLLGNSNDVQSFYRRAKIFAFTSNFEGFPNVLIEAMHFGLACISTDCPTGPSEIIQHNYNGLLIPVNDLEMLRAYLAQLMSDQELRTTLGKNAKKSSSKYQIEYIGSYWKRLFLTIIDQKV